MRVDLTVPILFVLLNPSSSIASRQHDEIQQDSSLRDELLRLRIELKKQSDELAAAKVELRQHVKMEEVEFQLPTSAVNGEPLASTKSPAKVVRVRHRPGGVGSVYHVGTPVSTSEEYVGSTPEQLKVEKSAKVITERSQREVKKLKYVAALEGGKDKVAQKARPKSDEPDGGAPSHEIQCFHIKGVPKSGTTWLTTLLEECFKQYCQTEVGRQARACHPGYCKSAAAKKHKEELKKSESQDFFVFIFRDTRDVLVSHFHWVPQKFKDLASFARSSEYGAPAIIKHQNEMYAMGKALDKKSISMGVVFYEDLRNETLRVTDHLTASIGMRLSGKQLAEAIKASSFDSMRAKEVSGDMHLKVHPDSAKKLQKAASRNTTDASKLFGVMTRKGKVGG